MARKDQDKHSDERPETGFKDVSGELEQAQKDAERPLELDDDGTPKPRTSEAANVIAQEQAYRASAQVNGGGPWPPELLRQVGTTALRDERDAPVYTSHEVEHEGA
jgi:hypothetical protein